jgi:hypothetical protein
MIPSLSSDNHFQVPVHIITLLHALCHADKARNSFNYLKPLPDVFQTITPENLARILMALYQLRNSTEVWDGEMAKASEAAPLVREGIRIIMTQPILLP